MSLFSKIRAAFSGMATPTADPQASREELDHPADYYQQAFEMATQGIEWPQEARDAVRARLAEVLNDSEWQANKALAEVWPEGFRWSAAELYLYDLDIELTPRQLMNLLRTQVARANYQLLRIEQVRAVAAHSIARGNTHVLVAHTGSPDGISRCGLRDKETRSCEMAESMAPCLVLGCDCSWAALRPKHIR